MPTGSLYSPKVVSAAAAVMPEILRQWHNSHGPIPEPLAFLGETTKGGWRRYSLGGVVLVRLVVQLGEFGIGPARAVPAANAVAEFVHEIEVRFAPHGADAVVKMAEVGPMAVLAPTNWPSRWSARYFDDREAYAAAKHLPALGLHLDVAALFQGAAVAVTQAATSIIYGTNHEQ